MSANERTPNSDRKPTQEELTEVKNRVAKMRVVLEDAGLQYSPGATTGTKLVRCITKLAGVVPAEMTMAQWSTAFAALDGLMNDPKKAVKIVDEWGSPTDEEVKIAMQRRAEMEEAWRKEREQRDEERRKRDERAGPHAQRANKLAAEFLRKLECEDYEGYAIVGVPNRAIESQFEKHMETCGQCRNEYEKAGFDLCDEGDEAMFEDGLFNIFAYSTRDVGGHDYGLLGELEDGNFDDVSGAEPYRPETDHPQVTIQLEAGKHIECDFGVADLIRTMNFPGIATHHSCQGTNEKDNFRPGYVTFSGHLTKQFAQCMLQELLADKKVTTGITFENSDCCCGKLDSLLMRWHPEDFERVLDYVRTAANKLRGQAASA
jgi:hypothetical protein